LFGKVYVAEFIGGELSARGYIFLLACCVEVEKLQLMNLNNYSSSKRKESILKSTYKDALFLSDVRS
jgi:hypothetical protein